MVLNEKLQHLVNELPKDTCGVYYLLNNNNQIIYIGKSINIRKRIIQHFRSTDKKEVKLQHFTHAIQFENTGNELIALLRESELIKTHLPIFNRAQRKVKMFYGLYHIKTSQKYEGLIIKKLDPLKNELLSFTSLQEAKNYLHSITEKYFLCQKINGLYKSSSGCFQYNLKECFGACVNEENYIEYNKRVNEFVKSLCFPKKDFIFQLKGRTSDEKGIVLIEQGVYKGFGYCKNEINNEKELKSFIAYKQDNRDVRKILFRHLKIEMLKLK